MSETKAVTSFKGVLLLLLTALVWGISFIAQNEGSELVQPFTFNGIRTVIGAITLLPVIFIKDRITARSMTKEQLANRRADDKKILVSGGFLGIALCLASNFQQFAFTNPEHSAGKIAFITAMYMFLVPIIGLFLRKRVPALTWLCVALGFFGLYFLCIDSRGFGSITYGDILAFICAVFYAVQILLVEKFAPDYDGVKLSCVQFFVSGIISCVCMIVFETPSWNAIRSAAIPILYAGVMSCGVAYTLQIIGQKFCEATVASLLMCMESVFAVLSEAVFFSLFGMGGKILSRREIAGCAVMFAAIILSQIVQMKGSSSVSAEPRE